MTYDADYYSGKNSGYILSYRVMRHPVMWRSEKRHIARFISGGDALDIGCAYGFFLENLGDGFNRHGIDVSEHAVTTARSIHGDAMRFDVCDVTEREPFEGQQFDLVTCFNVLEHFEDPGPVLERIAQCVKPGGLFYARFPFKDPLFCRDKYHHYRPAQEWIADFQRHFDVEMVKYVYTLWGKMSDIPVPAPMANFMAIMLRRRGGE
ncbi:class I SAM-dependent methyltransferase [Desulfovibrio ferrophilus]|uniref:Methionine biosynthesis protein MetW-like protein n=1 Tax=Desulfovibrio ferrophilus TaxID=241368 RepID=A0A2Z6B2D8_9BACT|nr:class I SAM-dependent methyltransferase [Desulfovibrio ferrophilus]BBD09615.1 methionine biosynthesis protein MetW-like protein [Desulfovibrio ferrophilus]